MTSGVSLEHSSHTPSHITVPWVTVYLADGKINKVVRYDQFVKNLFKKQSLELMKAHCGMGIASDAGEVADVIKRDINYEVKETPEGKSLKQAMCEELGDVAFYMQACMNLYELTWQDVLQHNANKLGKRYANLVYSDEQAQARADKVVEQLTGTPGEAA